MHILVTVRNIPISSWHGSFLEVNLIWPLSYFCFQVGKMRQSYVQKVSRKGQVSIPIEIRKKYNFDRNVAFIDDGERVVILPVPAMEESFGVDGDAMREVAKEIIRTRKREVSLEGR